MFACPSAEEPAPGVEQRRDPGKPFPRVTWDGARERKEGVGEIIPPLSPAAGLPTVLSGDATHFSRVCFPSSTFPTGEKLTERDRSLQPLPGPHETNAPSRSPAPGRGFAPGHALEGDAGRPAWSGRRAGAPAEEREKEDEEDEDAVPPGTALRYLSAPPPSSPRDPRRLRPGALKPQSLVRGLISLGISSAYK